MASKPKMESRRQFADKRTIRQIVAELNARLGFVPDPEATPEKVREMMRSGGVRPEDNLFSREILHM